MKKRIYPILFIVIVMIFVIITGGLSSCTPKSAQQIEISSENTPEEYQFNDFGIIKERIGVSSERFARSIAASDLDGDGDNDIIIAFENGTVIAMENVMKRKLEVMNPKW